MGSLLVGFEAASSLVACHFSKWASPIHRGRSLLKKDHVYLVIRTLLPLPLSKTFARAKQSVTQRLASILCFAS